MTHASRSLPLLLLCGAVLSACGGPAAPADPTPRDGSAMLESALPAVVTVAVETDEEYAQAFGFGGDEAESARSRAANAAYAQELDLSPYIGSGSGFVIERGGQKYVVTNSHVIDVAGREGTIDVFSVTRDRYPMRLVGADSYRDVAVLAFTTAPGPEVGTIAIHGRDDLRVGMPVYAVGNPLGEFPYTITSGVISGLNRSLEGFTARDGYLQTDATLIWGNSGGPLIGPAGDVVGLNSRIHLLRQLGGVPAPQINFSLEGPHLDRIVTEIIEHGRVQRPYLGIALMRESSWGSPSGPVQLGAIIEDTPASAVLNDGHIGAVVETVAGEPVRTLEQVAAVLEDVRPGQSVALGLRGGRSVSVQSATLTPERMEEVAEVIVASFFETRLQERSGGLYVASGPSRLPSNVTMMGDASRPPESGDQVTLAGVIGDQTQVWRVGSLHELGVVARLVLGSGNFGLVLEDGRGMRAAVADLPPLGIF